MCVSLCCMAMSEEVKEKESARDPTIFVSPHRLGLCTVCVGKLHMKSVKRNVHAASTQYTVLDVVMLCYFRNFIQLVVFSWLKEKYHSWQCLVIVRLLPRSDRHTIFFFFFFVCFRYIWFENRRWPTPNESSLLSLSDIVEQKVSVVITRNAPSPNVSCFTQISF